MKIKKIWMLFSIMTVLFSLTACSDGKDTVDFEYTDNDIVFSSVMWADTFQNIDDQNRAYVENEGTDVFKSGLSNFDTTEKECGKFLGYHAQDEEGFEDVEQIVSIDVAALNTDENANQIVLQFLDNLYSEVEEVGDTVIVTLKAAYEQRAVELRFVYEKDPTSAYNDSAAPYKLAEITTTPEYTTGEIMSKAGANTLMGMGTVFIVLIFISLIIAQFGRINSVVTKIANRKMKQTPAQKVEEKSGQTANKKAVVSGRPCFDGNKCLKIFQNKTVRIDFRQIKSRCHLTGEVPQIGKNIMGVHADPGRSCEKYSQNMASPNFTCRNIWLQSSQ